MIMVSCLTCRFQGQMQICVKSIVGLLLIITLLYFTHTGSKTFMSTVHCNTYYCPLSSILTVSRSNVDVFRFMC